MNQRDYQDATEERIRKAANYALTELLYYYEEGELREASRVAIIALALEATLHRPPSGHKIAMHKM